MNAVITHSVKVCIKIKSRTEIGVVLRRDTTNQLIKNDTHLINRYHCIFVFLRMYYSDYDL